MKTIHTATSLAVSLGEITEDFTPMVMRSEGTVEEIVEYNVASFFGLLSDSLEGEYSKGELREMFQDAADGLTTN